MSRDFRETGLNCLVFIPGAGTLPLSWSSVGGKASADWAQLFCWQVAIRNTVAQSLWRVDAASPRKFTRLRASTSSRSFSLGNRVTGSERSRRAHFRNRRRLHDWAGGVNLLSPCRNLVDCLRAPSSSNIRKIAPTIENYKG